MSWYSRFLVFIATPVVVILCIYNLVDMAQSDKGDGNVPIVRAVQDR